MEETNLFSYSFNIVSFLQQQIYLIKLTSFTFKK